MAKGRPSKLTDELLEEIVNALSIGATFKNAASYVGIHESTFFLWKNAGKAVYDRLEQEARKEEENKQAIKQAKAQGEPPPEKYRPNFNITADEERFLEFFKSVEQAAASGVIAHINFLYQMAPHDPKISMWVLQRRDPEGWAEPPKRHEHSGPAGKPIESKDVSDIPFDERVARLASIFEAAKQRKEEEEGGE